MENPNIIVPRIEPKYLPWKRSATVAKNTGPAIPIPKPNKTANKKAIHGWDVSLIRNKRDTARTLTRQLGIKTVPRPSRSEIKLHKLPTTMRRLMIIFVLTESS